VGAKLRALGTTADQQDGEILDTGVVTDHESRVDGFLQPPQAEEQLFRAGAIELVLDQHSRAPAEAGLDQLQRLPSAERGRTEDHLGSDPVLAEVLGEALRGAASARGQWPIAIGQAVIGPARLGMSEQVERRSHGSSNRR